MSWLRRHALVVVLAAFGLVSFAVFSWAEYGYFCDQAATHKERCTGFWSSAHLHDWIYNAASNWQSEALVGVVLVAVLLKLEGPRGADRGDT